MANSNGYKPVLVGNFRWRSTGTQRHTTPFLKFLCSGSDLFPEDLISNTLCSPIRPVYPGILIPDKNFSVNAI